MTTGGDSKAWEDNKDILKHKDYRDISNIVEEKVKEELTRESEEDTEEELFIKAIMSGEWQQGILMLSTCSVDYIFITRNTPWQASEIWNWPWV